MNVGTISGTHDTRHLEPDRRQAAAITSGRYRATTTCIVAEAWTAIGKEHTRCFPPAYAFQTLRKRGIWSGIHWKFITFCRIAAYSAEK